MFDRLDPTLAPNEKRSIWGRIRAEFTAAWQTEDHPRERLTVADEREHVIFYLAEVLYRILPAFYDEIALALEKAYGVQAESLVLPTIIRFGSWVGGDMDGNPDIHAKTIRETLARQQQAVVNAYFSDCQALAQSLSQSASRIGIAPDLLKRIEEYAALLPGAQAFTPARHDRMPYRVFLGQIGERLRQTYDGRPNGYENPTQLRRDVQLIADSLLANRGRHAGYFLVQRLLRRIATFGFHLATLDVRQHTEVHHQVLARGLDDPGWMQLTSGRASCPAGRRDRARCRPTRRTRRSRQAHAQRVRGHAAVPSPVRPGFGGLLRRQRDRRSGRRARAAAARAMGRGLRQAQGCDRSRHRAAVRVGGNARSLRRHHA